MSIVEEPNKAGSALVERVKAVLTRPGQTWDVIDAEPTTVRGLYMGYIVPLSAIGPVCQVIGQLAFGAKGGLGLAYRPPATLTIATGLLGWAMTLVGVYVLALIIEAIAPRFGAPKDRMKALKLVAYSATAAWLAGVFHLYPPLALLSVVGLYSVYLLWLGVPKLMKVDGDKAMVLTVCVVVAGLGVGFLVSILTGILLGPLFLLTGATRSL